MYSRVNSFKGMDRNRMQWLRVVRYIPMYMGMSRDPQDPYFVTDDEEVKDGEGWDCDGNTSGYYEVYDSFIDFKRHYPRASFTDDGRVYIGE